MIPPFIDNWNENIGELEGLLCFAQRWDEMLFDYSLDSHRFRLFNVPGICDEIVATYEFCKNEILPWGSLQSIRDELIKLLDEDKLSQDLLGTRLTSLLKIITSWDPKNGDHTSLVYAASTISKILSKSLQKRIYTELKTIISAPQKKEKIFDLSGRLLTEILRKGYSDLFIYQKLKSQFFSDSPVNDISTFDSFFSEINNEIKKYTVVFISPSRNKIVTKKANPEIIVQCNYLPYRLDNKSYEKIFVNKRKKGQIFLLLKNIQALDHHSARDIAERKLKYFISFIGFLIHKMPTFNPDISLVYQEGDELRAFLVNAPTQASMKRPDTKEHFLDKSLVEMLGPIISYETEPTTRERLFQFLRAHTAGTRATTPEDQFVNLWTALETLMSATIHDKIINTVIDRCIPVLCLKYFRKLLASIQQDIYRCVPDLFKSFFDEKAENEATASLLLRILTTEELKENRIALYKECEKIPLLKNRIYKFHKVFKDPKKAIRLVEDHKLRIEWHLRRMYRTRNVLIHAGQQNPFMSSLVENLHSYIDHVFIEVIDRLRHEPHHSNLDKVYFEYKIDFEGYMKSLNAIKNHEPSSDHSKTIVFWR